MGPGVKGGPGRPAEIQGLRGGRELVGADPGRGSVRGASGGQGPGRAGAGSAGGDPGGAPRGFGESVGKSGTCAGINREIWESPGVFAGFGKALKKL